MELPGRELPIWMNEGLAGYFEDAIFVGGRMEIGLANAQRIALGKRALATGTTIDFETLLDLTSEKWGAILRQDNKRGELLYAQSWSFVHFWSTASNAATARPSTATSCWWAADEPAAGRFARRSERRICHP